MYMGFQDHPFQPLTHPSDGLERDCLEGSLQQALTIAA